MKNKCFACDRPLVGDPKIAYCSDDQKVFVGTDCFRKIKESLKGYQPPKGGPVLYLEKPTKKSAN